ncbi:hypothetical protein FHG87_011954 [Trinorchestia longiramus]|nr:hypothetical protein FHG87_011954 [Trinorchestia longiramus]
MLFTLLFLFIPGAHASILHSTAVSVGKGNKISLPTSFRSLMSPSPYACLGECRQDLMCSAINYEGTTGTCELLPDAIRTTVKPGWTAFRQLEPITPQLMDPCASNPCPSEKVCIQYWPPAKLPHQPAALNYSVDGYACSGHDWLLKMQNEGKTKCTFKVYEDKDFPNYHKGSLRVRYYEGFAKFQETDCLSMVAIFDGTDNVEAVYPKYSSIEIEGRLTNWKKCYYWAPTCV